MISLQIKHLMVTAIDTFESRCNKNRWLLCRSWIDLFSNSIVSSKIVTFGSLEQHLQIYAKSNICVFPHLCLLGICKHQFLSLSAFICLRTYANLSLVFMIFRCRMPNFGHNASLLTKWYGRAGGSSETKARVGESGSRTPSSLDGNILPLRYPQKHPPGLLTIRDRISPIPLTFGIFKH